MSFYAFSKKQFMYVCTVESLGNMLPYIAPGFPKPVTAWGWGSFGANGIDAALNSGDYTYFFSGNQYIRVIKGAFGPNGVEPGYPKPISTWGWGSFGEAGIDACFDSGPVDYFFKGDEYIRVTRGETGPGTVDVGYPKKISEWGWGEFGKNGISAALRDPDYTYFISGSQYIAVVRKENTGPGQLVGGGPRNISDWGLASYSPEGVRATIPALNPMASPIEIASAKMMDVYRRTGGKFGPLGSLPKQYQGTILQTAAPDGKGGWDQKHTLGAIHLDDLNAAPVAQNSYRAVVDVAVMKCFGTFSSSGTDSTYAVITMFCLNPNATAGQNVVTQRTVIVDEVKAGSQIFKMLQLGEIDTSGAGILINTSIWRHVDGNADDIRDKIHQVINQSANDAASAIAGDATSPSTTAGAVGGITDWTIAGVKPIDWLTLGLANAIANLFADKLIDSYSYWIPEANIEAFADQATFAASIRDPKSMGLDFDVQANWPPRAEDEHLFSGGGGSYKIWFAIRAETVAIPVFPALQ